MGGKVWYKSKTLWFNGLLAAAIAFTQAIGHPMGEELIASIVCLGNVLLRFLTKEPVSIKREQ